MHGTRTVLIAVLVAGSVVSVAAQYGGWFIPSGGGDEKSPVSSVPGAVTRGKAVFSSNCARCHGAEGKGNGPDSDHASDLTDEYRDTINPEGVLFYKVWNGRKKPKMPAFKDEGLSKDQVWQVVSYAQTLRAKQ